MPHHDGHTKDEVLQRTFRKLGNGKAFVFNHPSTNQQQNWLRHDRYTELTDTQFNIVGMKKVCTLSIQLLLGNQHQITGIITSAVNIPSHLIIRTKKQMTPTTKPSFPMAVASQPSFSWRGVSPVSPMTKTIVRPQSLFSPTARTRMLPLPSVTCQYHIILR